MHIKPFILLLCSLSLFCACAAKPSIHDSGTPNNSVRTFPNKQDHTFELLEFCESYSNLTAEAQKKVFTSSSQALTANKNDLVHRIKLAIMLALPSSRLRDTTKAQSLLQDLLQEDSLSEPDSALIGVLYEYTLFDNKQLQKGREDTKKQELTQQKYDALLQKSEALEQKLDELKSIEKTMTERNTKADNKP